KKVIGLGRVTSIEMNHKAKTEAKKGDPSVAIRIEVPGFDTPRMFGRHFDEKNEIYSQITRQSIDILKNAFRNDVSKEEWGLIANVLKKKLGIQ
ncbi:hypothetical protein BDK51DRAFT_20506, partial [Blyttiomyces helicus]